MDIGEKCTLMAVHGLPVVVAQALSDVKGLTPTARLMMWHLRLRLDLVEYRELKAVSIASEMEIHENTAGRTINLLVKRGYLRVQERGIGAVPRAFVFPWSRIELRERTARKERKAA